MKQIIKQKPLQDKGRTLNCNDSNYASNNQVENILIGIQITGPCVGIRRDKRTAFINSKFPNQKKIDLEGFDVRMDQIRDLEINDWGKVLFESKIFEFFSLPACGCEWVILPECVGWLDSAFAVSVAFLPSSRSFF